MSEGYRVDLLPKAQKELDDLPESHFKKVDRLIRAFSGNPRPFGSIKLDKNLYRLRVGSFRILYAIHDPARRVIILHVKRRNEKTYRDLLD